MIDSISPVSVQHSNAASFKGELPYSKTQSQEKQGMSAAQKTLLGLGALATLTIGGLLVKKHFDGKTVKKLAEEIANSKNVLQNENGKYSDLYKKFDTKPLTEKLDEISKLPQKEQLNALENLESRLEFVQEIDKKLTGNAHCLPKGMKEIPAEVQKAYEEGDLLKTGELMQKHAAGLPNTRIPKIHGKTVDKTIKNVFGDNPPIKAHTYDLTKESPVIEVTRYGQNGFQQGYAGKEGTYFADKWTKIPDDEYLIRRSVCSKLHRLKGGMLLSEGVITIDGKSRKVLHLAIPDKHSGYDVNFVIKILSPNNKYTPVQEDLLKLAANPEKFNAEIFDKITLRACRSDILAKDPEAIHQYVNLDYDLLLSAIQSMVK